MWQRQLIFRSKLTMHTAYDRPDNSEPASVTSIAVSKFVFFDIEFIEIFINILISIKTHSEWDRSIFFLSKKDFE